MTEFETVIGLEVHVQLALASKLFSSAPAAFGGEPNTRVAAVDLGLPGVLPTLNGRAVELAVRAALALEGEVQQRTRFARKNYFYPDLPKGYQISQYDEPYCRGGRVPLDEQRFCRLHRIHLEEDAGKSIHTDRVSLVDLNRAGVALIEIVSEPDLRTPQDAHSYLDQLKQILRWAEISDCDMEKGSLRCDANISLRPQGATGLGTKVEIKNLNSFKMVQRALEYEERRQAALLAAGGEVLQETRLWDEERGETQAMRGKEAAADYRYFPEPDLPPLAIDAAALEAARRALPELPLARRARLRAQGSLTESDLDVLLAERAVADYYEATVAAGADRREASNWVQGELLRHLNEVRASIGDLRVKPVALAGLLRALADGAVNRQAARKVFARMLETGEDAGTATGVLGLAQIGGAAELAPIVERVLAAQPQAAADFRAGKSKALHSLKGMVMRETQGRADPALAEQLLLERLRAGH
jgi:aspartyl-tRNA(Asn)/glutamyl-tRNA(Gln) amidotransferase subunit B